jgi:hypothetical protein
MPKHKQTLEQEINEFLNYWDLKQMQDFFRDIIPLIDLYNIPEEQEDWVEKAVGEDNVSNVRLIRTVYLISRIAEFHAGKLVGVKMNFKNIYERMEKEGTVIVDER